MCECVCLGGDVCVFVCLSSFQETWKPVDLRFGQKYLQMLQLYKQCTYFSVTDHGDIDVTILIDQEVLLSTDHANVINASTNITFL